MLLKEYAEEEILYKKSDLPKIFYIDKEGKSHRYYPDFYIPKENLLIEVKSTYTYEASIDVNLLKEKSSLNCGYKFKFLILDRE